MNGPPNVSVTDGPDCKRLGIDPDFAPKAGPVLRSIEGTSWPGDAINASTLHMGERGSYACIEIKRETDGVYFLMTAQGAREFATALLASADEAEESLKAEMARNLDPILSNRGGARG
jgi:hypothetical protein